ncbi:uncharacterized protein LOC127798673 isoform X1 [Diospyros lotus]|uniref:uncharacterized protein LOC127798673 isoform X1 n=1 Tax=Diospyros lotus TaxID=55363 RepID=UPI0022505387|nr:uncharacterized protein LOC127798673 isoform X1 [Diospyros lotus]
MAELRSSPPPATAKTPINASRREESAASRIKKDCLSFAASLQEGVGNFKALVVGLLQGKKIRARNEKEATEADLQTAKMQVEAADAAEDTKRRIDKSI